MIIITGASRGVGRYLFETFFSERFEVIGTYNKSIEHISDRHYKIDITDYQAVNNWIYSAGLRFENLVLINCAGISYNTFAHKADINKWHHVIDVNIKGTFNIIHCLLPVMRKQGYGRIINFASVVTKLPTVGISAYTASKTAINGLTKVLAKENASKGITVNSINLGYSNIGMGVDEVPEGNKKLLLQNIPMGRFCEPSEIFKTVKFIIETDYINGSIIDLNGGLI